MIIQPNFPLEVHLDVIEISHLVNGITPPETTLQKHLKIDATGRRIFASAFFWCPSAYFFRNACSLLVLVGV